MSTSAGMPKTLLLPAVPDASWPPPGDGRAAPGHDVLRARPAKVAFTWPGAMLHYLLMLASYPSAAAAVVVIAELRHRPYPLMMAWSGVILAACLAPVGIWVSRRRAAPHAAVAERDPDEGNQVDAETTLMPRRDAPPTTPAPRLRSQARDPGR